MGSKTLQQISMHTTIDLKLKCGYCKGVLTLYQEDGGFPNGEMLKDVKAFEEKHRDCWKEAANPLPHPALPYAEQLLNSIVAADPNVKRDYANSDRIIRDLYNQCEALVKMLKK